APPRGAHTPPAGGGGAPPRRRREARTFENERCRASEIRPEDGEGRKRVRRPSAAPGRSCRSASAFDQPDFAGARPFAGLFRRELHPLSFAQQLEHGAADRAAVEEVFDSTLVTNETKALVDQQARDRPGWHSPLSSVRSAQPDAELGAPPV